MDRTSETKEKPKLPDIKRKPTKNRDGTAVRVQGAILTENKTKETKSTEKTPNTLSNKVDLYQHTQVLLNKALFNLSLF